MNKKRILVLFPDEWDRAAAVDPRLAAGHEFIFEGFDLFSFPDNARLFTFNARRFVDRMITRYRGTGLAAVVTSDEQFGPFLASLIAEGLGLPHTPLDAVLTLQHKYYARQAFDRIVPDCNPRYGLISRGFRSEPGVPLAFPFYVKPVKAAFSVLARRVDSYESLVRHTDFAWFERAIIERLVKPFGDVMRRYSDYTIEPFSMIAEEIVPGRQVTVNGYVRAGKVRLLGTVDSVMYPQTDQFQRFQYPSTLAPEHLARLDEVAIRVLEGVGFTHGVFNIEMRIDTATGAIGLIEVNPRAAGQFYDLFERVDGYSLFEAVLALECGEEPAIRHRAGRDAHAASFVLRDFTGEGLTRWPEARDVATLQARHRDVRIMVYPKRGVDLKREMKWLGSYRYAIANLGAATIEAMFHHFDRICADIDFHPASHRRPSVESMLAQGASD
jgi:ATP-grasp domain